MTQCFKDSRSLLNPHLRHYRHPRPQLMSPGFPRLENYFYRNTLHDFHVVAGSVLGRQQTETLSAGARDGIDAPLILLPGSIYRHLRRLAGMNVLQLRLLEICSDPEVPLAQRNDLHHLLAGLDVLPNLDRAIADRPADWRGHSGVLQVEFRLIEGGFFLLHDGFG